MIAPTKSEKILTKSNKRYVVGAQKYPDLQQKTDEHLSTFWTRHEIDTSNDYEHFLTLSPDAQRFILMIHAFFVGSDGIVMENINVNFADEIQIAEARNFYAVQMAAEAVHSQTYSMILEVLEPNEEKCELLFNAIDEMPCISKKALWAMKWLNADSAPFSTRIAAFAIVEGVFFSGSFCAIYYIKNMGLMPGLTFANEYISRDEGLHTDFAVCIHNHLENKIAESEFVEIMREAVEIELEFINFALPCRMIGMNADLMTEYIKFVANRLALQFGFAKIYEGATMPFPFMEKISIRAKSQMFERRNPDYVKAPAIKYDVDIDPNDF